MYILLIYYIYIQIERIKISGKLPIYTGKLFL